MSAKEVPQFQWKLTGYVDGLTVTLLKSVDRSELEPQLGRIEADEYYRGVAIHPIDAKVPPDPLAAKFAKKKTADSKQDAAQKTKKTAKKKTTKAVTAKTKSFKPAAKPTVKKTASKKPAAKKPATKTKTAKKKKTAKTKATTKKKRSKKK